MKVKSKENKKIHYGVYVYFFRGILSGVIISFAVVISKIGGPLLGGMFAMFPAMFIGTLVITYLSHGALFSSAVMKVSILSSISIVVYGIIVRYTYLSIGLWLGTLVSILISFAGGYLIYQIVSKKVT